MPKLSISTNLLVVQYNNGIAVRGSSPHLDCTPSDPRTPIKWTNSQSVNLIDKYGVTFSPAGLNHIAHFPAYYEDMDTPYVMAEFTCDLINVEQPNSPVDPQTAMVRFIKSKCT